MRSPNITRVKICCIGSVEEMEMAVRFGASAVGLVSSMPSGPGIISEDAIAEIAAQVPPGVDSFLLTCIQDATAVIEQHRHCRTSVIQLCDRMAPGSYKVLTRELTGIRIVQVIHVTGEESLQEAIEISPHVHALLLDSGILSGPVKELGGTGRTHDWSVSRKICESVNVPVFLAGGLRLENVAEAIRQVKPFGVDLCSGVRTNGRLDEAKLREFFHSVRAV
ncbi:MAG TPA: phosphoribosylanthranilate isomerase [Terriglobales bacterium]|nr:phosphoribosylanthranilate isomerase [Terriglobales bacterium]